jgi:N4-gp56 family major capsid protein
VPNVFTDAGTVYANLVAAAYDRELRRALYAQPIFRQFVDVHPIDVTNTSNSVTLTVTPEITGLATTPLTETVDPDSVAPPAPTRVTVTLNEYGNVVLETFKLRETAFTPPDPTLAYLVGRNMVATIDKLVQNQLDASTNLLVNAAGTWQTTGGAVNVTGVSASSLSSTGIRDATTLLRRRNAHGRDGADQFVGIIHPDVAANVLSDTGWLNPHSYVDTQNIYQAELGSYLGVRWITSPNCTKGSDGASGAAVYRTYVLGAEALVEAVQVEPHVVVGPKVDKLMRFNPLGWLALGGWSMFRQEACQRILTWADASSL